MNELLMLPGPTPLPPEVIKAQNRQMIGHREQDFEQLMIYISKKLKKVFFTDNDLLIFPASGTGGLEIAIVNTLSPGDRILSISNGVFADRFREIARIFNINVMEVNFTPGEPCDYELIEDKIKNNPDLKAVLFTHNETSTGVTNNVRKMGHLLKNREPILIVDAVSSLGGIPLQTDKWHLDIVITSSQKALMSPPGLAMLSVSNKAWRIIEKSTNPVYYWDLQQARKYYSERNQTPYTPAVSLLYGLQAALDIIMKNGLNATFARHKLNSRALRAGMMELNFRPFVKPEIASATVSAFYQPENLDFTKFKRHLLNNYKLHLATGQQQLRDKIFRIGHMGYIGEGEILKTIKALARGLSDFGYNINQARAIARTQEILTGEEF